jgi:hypothetical protein
MRPGWALWNGRDQRVHNARADSRNEIIPQKCGPAPQGFDIPSEYPETVHVEKKVEEPSVQKEIGSELPERALGPRVMGHQRQARQKPGSGQKSRQIRCDIDCNQQGDRALRPDGPSPAPGFVCIEWCHRQYSSTLTPALKPMPDTSTSFHVGMPATVFLFPLTLQEL